MAMTLRLSPELDDALQVIADARHTSKHSIVLQALEDLVSQEEKTRLVMESVARTLVDDAELMRRLADS